MKKVLLASSALMAAGMLVSGAASASEKIKLELGGYSKWWVVGAWQDGAYERAQAAAGAGGGTSQVDVKGDNEIFIGGSTTLDNGMTVGVMVELEAGGDTNTVYANNDPIDKSYAFLETAYGKVIVGGEANGTVLLHVMAPDAAGNWGSEGIVIGGQSIATPAVNFNANGGLKRTTEIDTDDNAEKITYVAPTFYGLTVGGSYIPDVSAGGTGDAPGVHFGSVPVYGVGALYAREFGAVGLKLSGGWVTYDNNTTRTGSDNEFSVGTQISYAGFTLGGSHRSVQDKDDVGDAKVWDIGLMYATGPWAVSAAYLSSKVEDTIATAADDEMTTYQASAKYSLGAGVDLLGTVGYVKYDDEAAKTAGGDRAHNDGWVVATGLGLTF